MFDNTSYEQRLQQWSDFRHGLETANDPLQVVIETYSKNPTVSIHTDPWTQDMWPSPWELIVENQYCEFCSVLGMCYSLQLTDRFMGADFEIHIGVDKEKSKDFYLLKINDRIIGYDKDRHISIHDLPKTIEIQKHYPMSNIQ